MLKTHNDYSLLVRSILLDNVNRQLGTFIQKTSESYTEQNKEFPPCEITDAVSELMQTVVTARFKFLNKIMKELQRKDDLMKKYSGDEVGTEPEEMPADATPEQIRQSVENESA
jgi:hypothetical protein